MGTGGVSLCSLFVVALDVDVLGTCSVLVPAVKVGCRETAVLAQKVPGGENTTSNILESESVSIESRWLDILNLRRFGSGRLDQS